MNTEVTFWHQQSPNHSGRKVGHFFLKAGRWKFGQLAEPTQLQRKQVTYKTHPNYKRH